MPFLPPDPLTAVICRKLFLRLRNGPCMPAVPPAAAAAPEPVAPGSSSLSELSFAGGLCACRRKPPRVLREAAPRMLGRIPHALVLARAISQPWRALRRNFGGSVGIGKLPNRTAENNLPNANPHTISDRSACQRARTLHRGGSSRLDKGPQPLLGHWHVVSPRKKRARRNDYSRGRAIAGMGSSNTCRCHPRDGSDRQMDVKSTSVRPERNCESSSHTVNGKPL